MKKFGLSIITFILLMVCFAFGASALDESGSLGGNVTYTYDSTTGEVVISGEGAMIDFYTDNFYGNRKTPFYNSNIKSVVIEDGVTNIGNYLFYGCDNLSSIAIPKSVNRMGNNAFYQCLDLKNIYISDIAAWCEMSAFSSPLSCCRGIPTLYLNGEPITEVVIIPDGVTKIANYAFYNCDNLTKITIPESVTSIGSSAFYSCEGLSNITIPNSVSSVGSDAFYGCVNLTSIIMPDGIKEISSSAFYNCTNLASIIIPDSVTKIGAYAFYDCKNLTNIRIPDGVTYIGDYAFSNCESLTSIRIPDGVTAINKKTFYSCDNLSDVNIGKNVTTISNNAFNYCLSLKNIIIPESVKTIASYAFSYTGLTNITIPDTIKTINSHTFSECHSLKSVTIPNKTTSIGAYAFKNCDVLEEIIIPDGVTTIGEYAFYNCDNLTSITIPDNVTTLGSGAFYNCWMLKSVTIGKGITNISSSTFSECSYLTDVTISEGTKSIGTEAFKGCQRLERIIIPASVTSIGTGAFNGCENLSEFVIPKGVEKINSYTFQNCSNLKTLTIPDTVTQIGYNAIYHSGLTDIYYYGIEEQWNAISIDSSNTAKLNSTNIHFIHDCQSDDEWIVISEPTVVSEGKKVKYCSFCGKEIYEKIPRLTIDWGADENYGLVNFTVVDATTLKPIENASLNLATEAGETTVYKTDADGKVSAVLPVGKITISASAEGKKTRNLKLSVTHREYNAPLIGLSDKPLVEASIDVKTMTYDEIINAGISVTDPSNYNVLKYTITFYYEGVPTEVTFYDNDGDKIYVEPDVVGGGYIIGKEEGQDVVVYPNERFYLIIKGEVFWLKQMLEVEMNVYNNSLTDTFEDVEATLIIPEGLSLAEMNEGDQTLVQQLDDVAEGGTTKCVWYVRCDEGGTYNIGVNLKGMLMPWEEEFEESFMTEHPIKVYDENALKLYVKAPTTVECGKSYDIVIGIENISDTTLYNVTHTVKNIEQGVVRHYSGGVVVKEVYADEKLDTSVFDAEFKPGDKLEITVNTNILFESEIYEDCIYRLVDVIIDAEDIKTQLDNNFGIYTEHLFGPSTEIPATCTENGEIKAVCDRCGKEDKEIIPAHGHNYVEGECEHCGDSLSADCTCNCHKTGFGGFIYKLLRIFWKLFKINQYCACGVAHY